MSYSWGSDTADKWSGGGFSYGSAKKAYSDFDASKAYAPKPVSMNSAYMVSARVLDAALTGKDKELIQKLEKHDILVLPGQYDSVEKVLSASKTPYTMVNNTVNLDPRQIVLVNCPGRNFRFKYKGRSELDAVRKFVEDGGVLVTTDWALESVIMEAFPGYISHGGKDTGNDVVEVDLVASGSPYTEGLGKGALKPIWWLEGSSYPIKLERNKDVDVLLGSHEMEKRYGEMPVAVKFPIGEGRVVHVTSHFYLQTAKSKYDAQDKLTGLDFATKFIGIAKENASQISGIEAVSFGALESAYTSIRFLHNIFLEKIKKNSGLEKMLLAAPKAKSLKGLPSGGQKSKKLLP